MTREIRYLSKISLLLCFVNLSFGAQPGRLQPFAVASIHFEQNATDGDAEVVFEVKGSDDGLAKLSVLSPDGRTVIDFTAADAATFGIRQFRFESPEPDDVESLKSAYPEGVYTFVGTTPAGDTLYGESVLSHELPGTTSLVRPDPDTEDVITTDLQITWTPVENLSAYIIYIEQDDLAVNITAKLPGSTTTFVVPDGFLLPGTEYQLGLGSVANDGNISFIETTFTTAGAQ